MHIRNSTLLLYLLSTTLATCLPTPSAKPIHLPLQLVKSKSIYKRSERLELPILDDLDISEIGITVQIGTPAQEFTLLFDTGSADTWVPSTRCTELTGCPDVLHHYDPTNSTTYQPLTDRLDITYSIGSAAGNYFTDVVSLGVGYTIAAQTMAMVDSAVGAISTQKNTSSIILDGILGAGLPGGTVRYLQGGSSYDPVPVSLYKAGLIPKPMFSVAIGEQAAGKVVFGDIITDQTNGAFVYTNLVTFAGILNTPRWMVNTWGFEFQNNTSSRNFKFNQRTPVGIDTGSNLMYLPAPLAKDLANTITSGHFQTVSGLFHIDCQYQESTDVLKTYFPGTNGKNVYISIPISKLVGKRESDGKCFFLFSPAKDKFILGNMFLRHFVVVYDFGNSPQIGFAPLLEGDQQSILPDSS